MLGLIELRPVGLTTHESDGPDLPGVRMTQVRELLVIQSNWGVVVPEVYDIPSGSVLEIESDGIMEII